GFMGTGASIQYSFPSVKTRKITVRALDNAGNPASASITVQPYNTPPKIWILKPTKGTQLYTGVPYGFYGASFDSETFVPLPCKKLTWYSADPQDSPPFPQTGCSPQVSFGTAGTRMIYLWGFDPDGVLGAATVDVT